MRSIQEVKKLDLPIGAYVVIGSGIMSALGIRESEDIDLLVTPGLFEDLKKRGWNYGDVVIDGRQREKLAFGRAEAYKDLWYGNERVDAADLIARAEMIEDIPFQPLEELVKMKRAMDREKDRRDIESIMNYLAERGA
ncbi:MAG: hypothetical protein QY323_01600 [Patescibacteria group bacterium]|nr:MAG: hypothetical protein QY323_01600 [Patescibacteria group bacterium]